MDYITRLCDMLEFVNNTIISETYYNESGKVLIEKKSKLYRNEIDCVKSVLECNVGNNYDRFLMLKAELEIHKNSSSHDFSLLSFLIAVFSFVTTGVSLVSKTQAAYMAVGEMLLLAVICSLISWSSRTNRSKWRQYIAVVLKEFEKERFNK
ncbi:hypothetical protein [Eubacterium sp.]|uniref:hypothetical protein n=1 Tax=Eubacterium sp. TaxID=142586 RepID=UPI00267673DF|nr:hypothetical protein [uncultured Eubacterium sp.]